MMTDEALTALRIAATLAHTIPLVRVRVRDLDRVLVDVAPHGTPLPIDAIVSATPCGFRSAVIDAWARTQAGQRLALLDLPPDGDPSIEIGLPPCGRTFAGGIHRVSLEGRYLYAFASAIPIDEARAEMTELAADHDQPIGMTGLGLRHDELTDVCVVFAEVERRHVAESEAPVIELLQSALAKFSVRLLLTELSDAARRA